MRRLTMSFALLLAAMPGCSSENPSAPLQADEWRVRWLDGEPEKPTNERPYARTFAVDHTGTRTQLELVVRNARGVWGKPADETLSEKVLHAFSLAELGSENATKERLQLEVYVEKLEEPTEDKHDARIVWRREATDGGETQAGSATFRRASSDVQGSTHGGPSWPLGDRRQAADEAVMLTEWDRGAPEPAPGMRTECTLEIRLR